MSTMIQPQRPAETARTPAAAPETPVAAQPASASLLEDQLPPALKAPRSLAVLTAVIGLAFFALTRTALRTSDIWGHLAYGRWIVANGGLPQTEPLLPLCRGVPWVDTAWLTKVAGVWVYERFGAAGMQFIHAASLTFAFAVLAWGWQRRTGSVGWTLCGLAVCGLLSYGDLLIQRPQDIGVALFAIVLIWGLGRRQPRFAWVGMPLLFAAWANLHGSFVMGLAVLAACGVGRAIDVFRRTGSLRLAVRSRAAWRCLLMLELCAAAAILNPRGLWVYVDVVSISRNPNVQALFDWAPITLRTGAGQMLAAAVLMIGLLYRISPRRVSAAEVLLLVGFGLGALWSQRMIVWFAPVAGGVIALHGAAAWRNYRRHPLVAPPEERRGLWTVTTLGLAWIYFAYSPFGLQRIHGPPTGEAADADFRRSVDARTPLDAVAYLRQQEERLPAGLMYNSHEFGDYLLWAAPARFEQFVHSHVHLIPQEVWSDYLAIHDGGADWSDKLDRYGVNTVLVDTTNYIGLIRALRNEEAWREVYADPLGLAVVFVRKRPI